MELPARDMIDDKNQAQQWQQREQEYGYRIHSSDDIAQLSSGKMNKFNFDSFDRDSDLLDENDLIELQAAQSILEECGLSSSKKKQQKSLISGNNGQESPSADQLNSDAF